MPNEIIVSSGVVRHNVTVSSGVTMEVLAGGDAIRTTVSSGGVQEVYGRALSTTLVAGDFVNPEQIVESGGVVNYVTFVEDSEQVVERGGIADNIALSASLQRVYGRVDKENLEANASVVIFSGGKIFDVMTSGSLLFVSSGGLVSGATILGNGGGDLEVSSGGYGRNIQVDFAALLDVDRGAAVSGVKVESGGVVDYFNRGPTPGVVVESGGFIDYVVRTDTVRDLTVSSGGSLIVSSGGLVGGAALLAGALETVSSRGRDSGAQVAGFVTVAKGGRVQDVTVLPGGDEVITAGGTVNGITISSGGFVEAYPRIFGGDLLSGGQLAVRSQTTVSGLTVHAGGVLEVLDAHYVSSGELYGYTRSGTPAVEIFSLAGDTAGLSCTVSSGRIGGTDITFVAGGGEAIVHAAAGFASMPMGEARPPFSVQSAHVELAAASPGVREAQA